MDIIDFWKRVRVLIKAHRITQKEFAAYINIPLSTFRSWMHYSRVPDFITAFDIAIALGVSLEYLAKGKEDDTTEEEKKKRSGVKEAIARIKNDMDLLGKYF